MLDETVSMVDFLHNSCRFFPHESCGQCTPCREGTALGAARCSTASRPGEGRLKDLELLLEIGDSIGIIPGTTICGLADGAAWPIKNAIRKFRAEFEEYIKRTNPARLRRDAHRSTRWPPAVRHSKAKSATNSKLREGEAPAEPSSRVGQAFDDPTSTLRTYAD